MQRSKKHPYSITSSARASSIDNTSRPSAFAWKLTMRSNFAETATSQAHLAFHRRDLILAEAGFHQVGDGQLQPVSRARIPGLTEISPRAPGHAR
jgi:hypothetical protein